MKGGAPLSELAQQLLCTRLVLRLSAFEEGRWFYRLE
jgi:hypothetical protein